MDASRLQLLVDLFHEKLHPFLTVDREKRTREGCVYCEIKLQFQYEKEIDQVIAKLKQIVP